MENASKALIIAGAILLSILIIGLGMFIFNQAKGAVGKASMDPQKVASYNAELEAYEGTQNGTNVRALCDVIRNHNNANTDDPSLNIEIKTSGTPSTTAPTAVIPAADVNAVKSGINAGKNYTVTFGYETNTGYIVSCVIIAK